jgi:hypothetical protein
VPDKHHVSESRLEQVDDVRDVRPEANRVGWGSRLVAQPGQRDRDDLVAGRHQLPPGLVPYRSAEPGAWHEDERGHVYPPLVDPSDVDNTPIDPPECPSR